jgi:hypothetical protein
VQAPFSIEHSNIGFRLSKSYPPMDTRGANRTFNLDLPLLLFLLFSLLSPTCLAQNTRSGVGNAERYWDCCKPDCAWPERGPLNQPIRTCSAEGEPHTDANLGSACGGGPSYPCSDQSPWAINDTLSYGFAGVFLMGRAADSWCCACYELTFTSGKVVGKKMIVQAHNSGFDLLTTNRFALAVSFGPLTCQFPNTELINALGPRWKHKLCWSLCTTVWCGQLCLWQGQRGSGLGRGLR